MSSGLDVQEFIAGYLAEAGEHLAHANAQLVALDAAARAREDNPKAVRELFRALHTIKGLSAMVGAEPIVDLSHELETVLRAADRSGGRLPPNALDLLLKGVREIEERVGSLKRGETAAAAPRALLEQIASLRFEVPASGEAAELALDPTLASKLGAAEREQLVKGLEKGRRAATVVFTPSAERAAQGLNITSVREKLAQLGELVKVLPVTAGGQLEFVVVLLSDAEAPAIAEAAGGGAVTPITLAEHVVPAVSDDERVGETDRDFVRVDVRRLDDALERLAQLVVTRSKLERAALRIAHGDGDVRALQAIVSENARQLRDLRGAIMRARMVRVSELLERAPLIVRGLSRASGKPVRLDVQAGDAEVDKTVADRLFPVLVHLLRNAVDHALERPDDRRAAGKPEEGVIRISCADHAGRELLLELSDDGRGIDREKVAQRAGAPVPQSDHELLELIARPGLSTLDAATRTSGRGYGMDIVRRVIVQELGGELSLETAPGAGTTFRMRVPLSVTIVDAFSFACGGETFVVPVGTVEDLAELLPERVVETPEPTKAHAHVRLFRHRGAAIPLYPLAQLLGGAATGAAAVSPKVIVARHGQEAVAFEVDRLIGKQEIAVRPLLDPLVRVPGVSGSTDLGDGRPTLVLDLPALAAATRGTKNGASA